MAPLEPSSMATCSLAPAFLAAFSSDHRLPEAVSRQAVAGRRDDHELIGEKWKDREVRVLEGRTDDSEVELVAQDLLLHPGTRPDLERDDKPGVQLLECAQGGRQDVDAHRRARPYAEVAALDPAYLLQRHRGLVEDVPRAARVAVEDRARLGELNALAEAVEQGQAQRLFQLFDLVRDRRLAEPELLGGEAEAPEVGHRLEGAQLTQRHRVVEV